MSAKVEMTRESVLAAVANGAKSLTQVAHAHGYVGSVSSTVAAKIRKLVPEFAQRVAGTYVEPKPEAKPEAKSAVQVRRRKGIYCGMYGAVYALAVKAGEVPVHEFIKKATKHVMGDPASAKSVERIRSKNPNADLVAQVTRAITFAVGVIRTSKHRSNMGRSVDASDVRGSMRIVPVEG